MVETGPEQPTYASLARPSPAPEALRRRPVLPWLLTATAVAFALGLLANPSFERSIRARIPGLADESVAPAQSAELAALRQRIALLEARPASTTSQPALNDPLAADEPIQIENRIDGIDERLSNLQSQVSDLRSRADISASAAAEGAERAQTVLLISALRRTLETGERADALEPALRARFGDSHPAEVASVIALGRAPVTVAQLRQGLERLRPVIAEQVEPSGGNWWASFKQGLTGIVAVRREDDPANPSFRVGQASRRLASSDVDDALTQIAMLPPASRRPAAGWMASARRRADAMRALAQLEIAALTPPAATATPTTL